MFQRRCAKLFTDVEVVLSRFLSLHSHAHIQTVQTYFNYKWKYIYTHTCK